MSFLKDEKTFGKYWGRVIDNKDPKQMGKVRCILQDYAKEELTTSWLTPVGIISGGYDMGEFKIPPLNSIILVEFIDGDFSNGIYYGSIPQWKENKIEPSFPIECQDEFNLNNEKINQYNPDNYIYKTAKGHKIFLCDNNNEERIELQHAAGFGIDIVAPITKKIRSKGYVKQLKRNEKVKSIDLPQGSYVRLYGKDSKSEIILYSSNATEQSSIKIKTDKFELKTNKGSLLFDEKGNFILNAKNKTNNIEGITIEKANAKKTTYKNKKEIVVNTKESCCGDKTEIFLENCGGVSKGNINQIVSTDKNINLEILGLYKIKLNNEKILISDMSETNKVSLTSTGIELQDINQNKIKTTSSGIEISSNTLIKLDGGNEPYIKLSSLISYLTTLETWLSTHTHTSVPAGGPTSPPVIPLSVTASGSNLNSTKIMGE